MGKNFSSLGVSPSIIKAIEEMDFVTATNVQSEVIPHIFNKKDLIVMSKTGSGKTGAFATPILQMIESNLQGPGPQGLVLTPTRELAVQVDSDLKKMSKYLKLKTTAVYGQHNIGVEIREMKRGASVVTGTPGRAFDHIQKKTLVTKNIKFLVIDEADRMLDMGFIDQVVKIIKTLPRNRVTLLFSATMPSAIQRICKAYMKEPIFIELKTETKTADTIKQLYYRVEHNEKRTQLNRILKVEQPDSCMIFCNTRIEVDKVQAYLNRKGYVSDSLHGANTQSSRMKTIEKFKKGNLQILVATDVAARGIHIDDLSLVINYDVPMDKDSYVHRIGRTGRAGHSGKAITLVTVDDIMSIYAIEEHVGALIDEEDLPTDAFVEECVTKADGKWVGVKPQQYKPKTTYKKSKSQHKPKYKSNSHKVDEHKATVHKPNDYKHKVNKPSTQKSYTQKPSTQKVKSSNLTKTFEQKRDSKEVKTQTVMTNFESKKTITHNEPTKKKSIFRRLSDLLKGKK